ncbi:hypothetical protein AGLY_004599 [Aphis glycines]|uniref:Uncharacterized protein n=1 Tax=Aphis glycines TaxID=307491 RepID=A0A6G0TV93_APHGL|nr:hypothetical protein AGLY_004599 [Aphis glycines]
MKIYKLSVTIKLGWLKIKYCIVLADNTLLLMYHISLPFISLTDQFFGIYLLKINIFTYASNSFYTQMYNIYLHLILFWLTLNKTNVDLLHLHLQHFPRNTGVLFLVILKFTGIIHPSHLLSYILFNIIELGLGRAYTHRRDIIIRWYILCVRVKAFRLKLVMTFISTYSTIIFLTLLQPDASSRRFLPTYLTFKPNIIFMLFKSGFTLLYCFSNTSSIFGTCKSVSNLDFVVFVKFNLYLKMDFANNQTISHNKYRHQDLVDNGLISRYTLFTVDIVDFRVRFITCKIPPVRIFDLKNTSLKLQLIIIDPNFKLHLRLAIEMSIFKIPPRKRPDDFMLCNLFINHSIILFRFYTFGNPPVIRFSIPHSFLPLRILNIPLMPQEVPHVLAHSQTYLLYIVRNLHRLSLRQQQVQLYSPPVHSPFFFIYFHAFSGCPPLHPSPHLPLQHEFIYSPDKTLLKSMFEEIHRRSLNAEAVDRAYAQYILRCLIKLFNRLIVNYKM